MEKGLKEKGMDVQTVISSLCIWFVLHACFWFMSSGLYVFQQDERWFSRAMASLFCQGIAAILYTIKNR